MDLKVGSYFKYKGTIYKLVEVVRRADKDSYPLHFFKALDINQSPYLTFFPEEMELLADNDPQIDTAKVLYTDEKR